MGQSGAKHFYAIYLIFTTALSGGCPIFPYFGDERVDGRRGKVGLFISSTWVLKRGLRGAPSLPIP